MNIPKIVHDKQTSDYQRYCDGDFIDYEIIKVIPEKGTTKVKNFCFCHNTNLKIVYFDDNINEIGDCAFLCCKNIREVYLNKKLLILEIMYLLIAKFRNCSF